MVKVHVLHQTKSLAITVPKIPEVIQQKASAQGDVHIGIKDNLRETQTLSVAMVTTAALKRRQQLDNWARGGLIA